VDLPIGKGKAIAGNARGLLNKLIGGWQVASLGQLRTNYFTLSSSMFSTGQPFEMYGYKYPIQNCTATSPTPGAATVCQQGYLWFNGYIPKNQINSHTTDGRPNGIMGVPDNYKPAFAPLIPYGTTTLPANAPANTDISQFWDTNTVWIPLKDGTVQRTTYSPGLNAFQNQYFRGVFTWTMDAGLIKNIPITDKFNLRFNADAFNVLNHPGTPNSISGTSGILNTFGAANGGREVEFTMRLTW
jgi:hypothetical protein